MADRDGTSRPLYEAGEDELDGFEEAGGELDDDLYGEDLDDEELDEDSDYE
jgi:hypothetical protein